MYSRKKLSRSFCSLVLSLSLVGNINAAQPHGHALNIFPEPGDSGYELGRDVRQLGIGYDYSVADITGLMELKTGMKSYGWAGDRRFRDGTTRTIRDELSDSIRGLANGEKESWYIATMRNAHATTLVISKEVDGRVRFIFADPAGGSIDPASKAILAALGYEVIDLNMPVQNGTNDPYYNSCGAYAVELASGVIEALQSGKLTREEILLELSKKDWSAKKIRAEQYRLVTGEYPDFWKKEEEERKNKKIEKEKKPQQNSDEVTNKEEQKLEKLKVKPTKIDNSQKQKVTPEIRIETKEDARTAIQNLKEQLEDDSEKLKDLTSDTEQKAIEENKKQIEDLQSKVQESKVSGQEGKKEIHELKKQIEDLQDNEKKLVEQIVVQVVYQAVQISQTIAAVQVMNILSSRMQQTLPEFSIGVGSGSSANRYGIWVQGFGGVAEQEQKSTSKGFKANGFGFSAGLDAEFAEDLFSIGAAFTHARAEAVLSKNEKNQTSINNNLVSIYTNFKPIRTLAIEGQVGYGFTNLMDQESTQKIQSGNILIASANAKYNLFLDQTTISPKIGIDYFSGTFDEQKDIQRRLSVVGGISMQAKISKGSGFCIIPEIHVNGGYLLSGDNKTLENIEMQSEKDDSKITCSAGGGIKLTSESYSATIGFDKFIRKNFTSINGYLKVNLSL